MRVLTKAIMSVLALVAIFHRNLVHGKICSCCGVLGSLRGLQPLTVHVVALWVASGNESSGTLEDVNVSGVYISKNIALHSVRSVRLTHLTLERQSRIRTQPPYHTTHLTQPDAAPNPQDAPDAAPHPQGAPDATPNTQDAI